MNECRKLIGVFFRPVGLLVRRKYHKTRPKKNKNQPEKTRGFAADCGILADSDCR